MCLNITEESLKETKKLQDSDELITAYKILENDNYSQFQGFKWKTGLNKSNRSSTKLKDEELNEMEINKGFHFLIEKPEKCWYPRWYRCRYLDGTQYLCQNRYKYKCNMEEPINKIVKFTIEPKDIVAIGTWENIKSLVATKATMIKD